MRIRRAPTQHEIAARAYEIHQQRGHAHGRALDDWLQAEAELTASEAAAEAKDTRRTVTRRRGAAKRKSSRSAPPKRRRTQRAR